MNRILSPNGRHQGTALGKSCPLRAVTAGSPSLLEAASSHPPLPHSCHSCGETPGAGGRALTEEGGGPSRLPRGSILNSQECVTAPEPGQGVPALGAPGWALTLRLPTCFYFYDHALLSPPQRQMPATQTFLPAQEAGLVHCRRLINKCVINFLTSFSPFSFPNRQFGYA